MILKKMISPAGIFFMIFSVVGVSPLLLNAEAEEHSYVYRERTGDRTNEYQLIYKKLGQLKSIVSRQDQKLFQAICHEDGSTLYWSYENQCGDKVTARVVDDQVHIFGKLGDKVIDSTFSLGDDPWYQPLSYSLRRVLDESSGEINFWTIRPDKFTPVLLKAHKVDCSKIQVEDNEIDACRIEISKSGLLGHFWSASYWFRQSDGLFVQYRGTHGLPGTDETLIQLVLSKTPKQVAWVVPPAN